MKAIQILLRGSNSTTSAHTSEETKGQTVFSRRADSGGKLFSSLKNLFSRTEKSPANRAVAEAVPQATMESIRTEKKQVHFEPDQDSRKTQLLSDFTEVANNSAEKKSNQMHKPVTKDPEQLSFEKSFMNDFDTKLRSILPDKIRGGEKDPNIKIFCETVIKIVNAELDRQINNGSNDLQKENIEKEVELTLNSQFKSNIPNELLAEIKNAVSISFDFADAEELRKMQAGEFK